MKIEHGFYIPFHRQLIQYSLDYAYKNQFVTFEIIKNLARPRLNNTINPPGIKEEDIHYIFDLLCKEAYLAPDRFGIEDSYEITDKGRIFYLVTFW